MNCSQVASGMSSDAESPAGKMVPVRMIVNTLSLPGAPFLCCSLDTEQRATDRGRAIVHYAILVLIPLVSED